jgi:hypothetical protein
MGDDPVWDMCASTGPILSVWHQWGLLCLDHPTVSLWRRCQCEVEWWREEKRREKREKTNLPCVPPFRFLRYISVCDSCHVSVKKIFFLPPGTESALMMKLWVERGLVGKRQRFGAVRRTGLRDVASIIHVGFVCTRGEMVRWRHQYIFPFNTI